MFVRIGERLLVGRRLAPGHAPHDERDQGIALVYGFNHEEAIRSFQRSAELDPNAAMPYWGIAWAASQSRRNAWSTYCALVSTRS